MSVFGSATSKWLNDLSESTRATYLPGVVKFQEYLNVQTLYPGIRGADAFLKAVHEDSKLDFLDQKLLDRDLIKGFSNYLVGLEVRGKPLSAKTVRTYVGGVQSLGAYWKIPIDTSYAELPPAVVENEKFAWKLSDIGKFIESMDSSLYRCLGVWFVQSGLSVVDVLHLTYGKVREQLEAGVSPLCLSMVRFKTRRFEVKFRTFVGSLGVKVLKEYVSMLKPLGDDDLIFGVTSNAVEAYFARRAKEFLSVDSKGRNPCCPSSLRTGFRSLLADAKCPESFIEYWMGHNLTGDLRKTYTNLSDDSWRSNYSEYEPCLTPKLY